MQQPSKERILSLYNRLVKEHGGRAIGERVFLRESGVSRYYWQGGYRRSWSPLRERIEKTNIP
jgi:hypothetical protein